MTWGRKKNVTMALRLSQIRSLKSESERRGVSQARILRDALDMYLETSENPGEKGSARDRALHHLRYATLWMMHTFDGKE